MIKKMIFLKLILIILFLNVVSSENVKKLTNYQIKDITVSGISSGGAMAVQVHVALSSTVSGSGNIAGPPYYCSRGSLLISTTWCMSNLLTLGVDMNAMISKARYFESQNLVDNLQNLKNQNVYVFSGTSDIVTSTSVAKKNEDFFRNFMDQSRIRTVYSISAAHGMVTDFYGGPCSIANIYFMNDCSYNQAFDILSSLHPNENLKIPNSGAELTGMFAEFDQSEFFSDSNTLMDSSGYIYVPQKCETEVCNLHIAFHGCLQGKSVVGNIYAKNSGYNQVADLNNFIVIYPQAKSSLYGGNPSGCWDWWGYTDSLFATKQGKQIKVIKAIIDRVAFNN